MIDVIKSKCHVCLPKEKSKLLCRENIMRISFVHYYLSLLCRGRKMAREIKLKSLKRKKTVKYFILFFYFNDNYNFFFFKCWPLSTWQQNLYTLAQYPNYLGKIVIWNNLKRLVTVTPTSHTYKPSSRWPNFMQHFWILTLLEALWSHLIFQPNFLLRIQFSPYFLLIDWLKQLN